MLENFGSKTTNIIVLDLEDFKLKSLGFITKELTLCSSYKDKIFFKPPFDFADLPAHDRQTVIWLTNNLHGLDWDQGDKPYCFENNLSEFQFPIHLEMCFAKGIEKWELLSKVLQKNVDNLEDLNCPRLSEIYQKNQYPSVIFIQTFVQQTINYQITARNVKQEYFHSGQKLMHREDTAT